MAYGRYNIESSYLSCSHFFCKKSIGVPRVVEHSAGGGGGGGGPADALQYANYDYGGLTYDGASDHAPGFEYY